MDIYQTVTEKLDSISWDFVSSATRNSLHSIHPYPAKFIPEIPHSLISLFHPGDCSAVLDPFCGSGTTLLEAKKMGLPAIGVDLHPLAALIARVKTTAIPIGLEAAGENVLEGAKEQVRLSSVSVPHIPNLDHWFQKPVQEALAALVSEIENAPGTELQNALKVAFSSIVVKVSNQDSDTRYAARDKNITQSDTWAAFERAVSSLARLRSQPGLFSLEHALQPSVHILNKDIMLVEPEEIRQDIGLVVTSPPYPNAYEYWLYHKYRMFWLGMDPQRVKESEIGARAHFFKKNHHTEHDFERQMGRCFWLLSKVMKEGAYACFVVGRSIIHGREIDNEAILEKAAMPQGFRKIGSAGRKIAPSRKSFNLHHAKIQREGVVIFRLEKL